MDNIFTRAWHHVKAWASKNTEVETVLVELTTAEHKLLQKFHPLFNQILTTIGHQGIQIVDDALTGVIAAAGSGGNVSAGIAAAATEAFKNLKADVTADSKNAVYGVLAASVAAVETLIPPVKAPDAPTV